MLKVALSGASAIALAMLAGCSATGTLNPAMTSDIQAALSTGCPILGAVQASGLPLNKYQASAVATLALACPPNPPPTSAYVAASDLIAAYVTLQPLLTHK